MLTFDWNLDPVAFSIPKLFVVGALALAALSLLAQGLKSKVLEPSLFGVVLGIVSLVVWNMAPEGIPIRYYSLIFVAVFLGGYWLLNWQVRRGGGGDEEAGDFIVYGVLGVLIGARLGHVIFYDLDKALRDPAWIFQIWTGGLASHGAGIGLIVAMYLFTRRRGVAFLEGADRFAFSAALGATLVRLGNFFNSEIIGRATDQTWGVRFLRLGEEGLVRRHPSQLYEVALGLFVLGALWLFDRALGRERRPRGAVISLFFIIYFIGRFVVEFFKEYQTLDGTSSVLTMGQYLSIPGVLLGIYGLWWSFSHRIPAGWGTDDDVDDDDDEVDDDEVDDDEDDDDEDDDEVEDEDDEVDQHAVRSEEPIDDSATAIRRQSPKQSSETARALEGDPDVDEEFGGSEEERRKRAQQARRDAGGGGD